MHSVSTRQFMYTRYQNEAEEYYPMKRSDGKIEDVQLSLMKSRIKRKEQMLKKEEPKKCCCVIM